MRKIGIHQPNFMPWLGYFYKIMQSDTFVFLDDVQFPKTGASYTNRVSILQNGKAQYLTVPIKRLEGTWNINECKFALPKWKNKITGTLQAAYGKANYFKKNKDFIFDLINYETEQLSEFNINFIKNIAANLGYEGAFVLSSSMDVETNSTKRLIDIIKKENGNVYLSGKGGENYQDETLFTKNNIKLMYLNYPNISYNQYKSDSFVKGLSVVDAIFNVDFEAIKVFLTEQ